MKSPERALAVRRALARGKAPRDPLAGAEARLAAALAEVAGLDLEVEALSADLDAFARLYERRLAAAFADLELAERLVRRIQADDLAARLRRGRCGVVLRHDAAADEFSC